MAKKERPAHNQLNRCRSSTFASRKLANDGVIMVEVLSICTLWMSRVGLGVVFVVVESDLSPGCLAT